MAPPAAPTSRLQGNIRRTSVSPIKSESVVRRASETPRSSEGRSSIDATDNSEMTSTISEEIPAKELHESNGDAEEDDTIKVPTSTSPREEPQAAPKSAKAEPLKAGVKTSSASPRPKAAAAPPSAAATALAKENEQLKAKFRVMEKKRMEDREKLKALDQLQQERDRLEGLIQKLQQKYQPQQQELAEMRQKLAEAEIKVDQVERIEAEKDSEIEMATLDREMAEELAESYKAEADTLREQCEDLKLEMQVLQEENDLFNEEIPEEEKSSRGWIQLEKENARLRDALIRLREMTQDSEDDLLGQIKEMEDELKDLDNMRNDVEETKELLRKSEQTAFELREQLEAAEAQEEVIENLTETNSRLQTETQDLRGVIQELEDMQALNDEMEADHQATEKELQSELDFRESIIMDHRREFAHQMRVIEELEFMVGKYKDTMTGVQQELLEMRESRQISDTEAAAFDQRSKAVMDLQIKLQSSEKKATTKKIDMELQKLKAEESEQHLAILQNFVLDSFDQDRTPIDALLRFRRIAFKALIMQSILRDQGSTQLSKDIPETLLRFEIEEKLDWMNTTCTRFVAFSSHCTVPEFESLGKAFYELEGIEGSFDTWIERIRQNELDPATKFDRKDCSDMLGKHKAIFVDLSEKLIPSSLATEADALHCQTMAIQSSLQTVAELMPMLKDIVTSSAVIEEDMDADVEAGHFSKKIQDLEFQSRSTKVVAGKAATALEEMIQRSDSFIGASSEMFEPAEILSQKLSKAIRCVISDIYAAAQDDSRENMLAYPEITSIVNGVVADALRGASPQTDAFKTIAESLVEIHSRLTDLNASAMDISRATEFERHPAPWTVRAKEIKAKRELSAETEESLRRLKSDLQAKAEILASKDQQLEEQHLRISLLESRTKDAKETATIVKDLEAEVDRARQEAVNARDNLSQMAQDYEKLEAQQRREQAELEKLKQIQSADGGATNIEVVDQSAARAMEHRLSSLTREIESLQSAVRYLKTENHRLQLPLAHSDLSMSKHAWLNTPLPGTARAKAIASRSRTAAVAKESQELFDRLLDATERFKVVELTATTKTPEPVIQEDISPNTAIDADSGKPSRRTKTKSTWRPMRETPRYHVLLQREELERWDEMVSDLVAREKGFAAGTRRRKADGGVGGQNASKIQNRKKHESTEIYFDAPDVGVPGLGGDGVRIVGSD